MKPQSERQSQGTECKKICFWARRRIRQSLRKIDVRIVRLPSRFWNSSIEHVRVLTTLSSTVAVKLSIFPLCQGGYSSLLTPENPLLTLENRVSNRVPHAHTVEVH